jgi:hypothetical protein
MAGRTPVVASIVVGIILLSIVVIAVVRFERLERVDISDQPRPRDLVRPPAALPPPPPPRIWFHPPSHIYIER